MYIWNVETILTHCGNCNGGIKGCLYKPFGSRLNTKQRMTLTRGENKQGGFTQMGEVA